MRLGIFGGTFDPVHYGHLLLAECCRGQCRLDTVWFLPTAVAPHKKDCEITPAPLRCEMLELALAGNEAFSVCRYETDRGGVNYTAETLSHLHQVDPSRELFFLVGSDMFRDLPHWRDAAEVCRLALPVHVHYPGKAETDFSWLSTIASSERIELISENQVEMPEIGIHASALRRRVAAGLSIRYYTPRAVEEYIVSHQLYRAETGATRPS
ncbi:MAG: nicotinate (nicotinamide) nucleotide adenylyltransferase [Pirellulales bacterium]|nr:nicotinate (nicotinamide) nucleotide adenylyltransferase [Pirellulales bacterium]